MKNRYVHSSVSEMLHELRLPTLSQRRYEARLIILYKMINGLAEVPFEGVLIEVYKNTQVHTIRNED